MHSSWKPNTANPSYNGKKSDRTRDDYPLAVSGFIVRKIEKIKKKEQYKILYVITRRSYIYSAYWQCILWCISVNIPLHSIIADTADNGHPAPPPRQISQF
jgi:hypothetical protein